MAAGRTAAERRIAVALVMALLWGAAAPLTSGAVDSVVTQWLTIAQNTVISLGLEHQPAVRLYSLVASAQYDVILLARDYKAAVIPEEAAAAYASHAVLSAFFNWRQTQMYDVALTRHLAQYNVSDSLLPALERIAIPVVQRLLIRRLKDRSTLFANFKPASNSSENWGRYQYVPGQSTSRYPQVANATPFWLTSDEVDLLTAKFIRFSLDDPEYARQLNQVYLYGSANSTVRSAYDTDTARFWALGTGTGTIAGFWFNISIASIPANTSLAQQARFFKLLGTSMWDAAVACWRVKYRELFWRPITAIRTYHGVMPADPSWSPLLPTPQFPEYPSGHVCTAGVAVYALETFMGNNTAFTVASPGAPDIAPRSYLSFRAAGLEAGASRLFAGAHFAKANEDALELGYGVARHIHAKKFRSATFRTKI